MGQSVSPEDGHTGIVDVVSFEHSPADETLAVADFIGFAYGMALLEKCAVGGDPVGIDKSYFYLFVIGHFADESFQESMVGIVVCFCYPDVLAFCQFKSFLPLFEGRAAVLLIIYNVGDALFCTICFDDFFALVCG